MAFNLLARLGLDPSGYNRVIATLPKTTESVSKKIAKSLDFSNLSNKVSESLGETDPSKYISEVNSENIDKAITQLNTLIEYKKRLRSMGYTDKTEDDRYGAVSQRIKELNYDIRQYEEALKKQSSAQEESGETARKAGAIFRNLSQRLRSIGSHAPGIRKTSEEVGKIGTRSKASIPDIGRMVSSLRRVALVSFAFRIAGAALGRLRSIVSQYISENATLQAQVNGLKAAMGQALAPAINLVVNAMSALLPYVVGVSNAIGQLIAALFGDGWTASANGAKKAAAATGSAAKAQKELNRQLMSYDEINKLSDNSSGGSGGGGTSTDTNITPISGKMPAWMERFKTSFSELFNSEEFKAANIGGKIGMALQTGLDWLGSEAAAFDWRGAGTKLRENFDSFMESGWIESGAKAAGIFVGAFVDAVLGFLSPDFAKLKETYEQNGAKGIAWYFAGMRESAQIKTTNWSIDNIVMPMFSGLAEYFHEQGQESIAGFFDGIVTDYRFGKEHIKQNIIDPIVNWFKELLGIHSPSTVFAEIGSHCMIGLGNGFSDGISGVLDKLRDLKDRVLSIADRLKEAFSFEWRMPSLKLPHLIVNWDPVDNVLANFFGVTAFPRLSVSWFAKGGILNGAQIFGRMGSTLLGGGEAGKEAVLPLESNTGWMDKIAERVVSRLAGQNGGDINATIYLTLDGEVLTRVVIKDLRKYARANGGLPI